VLTRTGGYALHAALAIAEMGADGRPVRAHEVAAALSLPSNYLAKILQALARAGVLESERGRHGGFRLAKEPSQVRLIDVVEGFDDLGRERQCLLGRGLCKEVGGCPAHREWREASAAAFRFFENRTLADLMAKSTVKPAPGA
jgi:Rrf2 family transcriptional regulator, iron-sulfur cluster assembly transcription factor